MRIGNMKWISVMLAVALVFCSAGIGYAGDFVFKTPGVSGDTSSEGAVITVALFVSICVVMVLLGMKADYQNVFGNVSPEEREAREKQFEKRMAALLEDSDLAPMSGSLRVREASQWADGGLGLRVEF
ncbi:MAG: hypothetical protein BWY59_01456 [Verrucomicrobia bacterium ADurb.Bin345]|nr:MAG: hypothetical protein BWY59_01456 [Verrucomicrobia bacterium ADurb.Bin345]